MAQTAFSAKSADSSTFQPETIPNTAPAPLPAHGKNNGRRRMLIIGLDCAPPELVFDQYRADLPHIDWLMRNGLWGQLESCHPPITVPAWSAMMSSQDPGQLGFYGFRNRADYSYEKLVTATSRAVKVPRVWDILSRAGKQVAVVGVPQTYPVSEVNGVMVSCFLTPSTQNQYTYPNGLRSEIESVVGEYMVDVKNFRTENKDWLLQQIYEMTEKRFRVVRHFLRNKPWDFFMFVEMGTDRIHHGFWKFSDPSHPKYEPGNRFETAIRGYYKYLDREIGELMNLVDDQTVICVISDHGAKGMAGGICINEWLIQNGYLALKSKPPGVVPLTRCEIDWSKTKAWAEGGYYGRLFINVKGREPHGIVPPGDYEKMCETLAGQIEAIPDAEGRPINTKVHFPQQLYHERKGVPPDLLIYFGNLAWRSVGSIGAGRIHTFDNDTGPDDANHAQHGIFVMHDPQKPGRGKQLQGMNLVDVAPTVLRSFDLPIPDWMIGKSVV
jgi:predicted AlkP superfamily phosphohydrolase/phosphomutase